MSKFEITDTSLRYNDFRADECKLRFHIKKERTNVYLETRTQSVDECLRLSKLTEGYIKNYSIDTIHTIRDDHRELGNFKVSINER